MINQQNHLESSLSQRTNQDLQNLEPRLQEQRLESLETLLLMRNTQIYSLRNRNPQNYLFSSEIRLTSRTCHEENREIIRIPRFQGSSGIRPVQYSNLDELIPIDARLNREYSPLRGIEIEPSILDGFEEIQKSVTRKRMPNLELMPEFGLRYLRGFIKQGQRVSEEELEKYGIEFDEQRTWRSGERGNYGSKFGSKYFDMSNNFCLTYEGRLIASLGFEFDSEGNMVIGQIQGIKEHGEQLRSFKWERALVKFAMQYAEERGIEKVKVISVANNKWAQKSFDYLKRRGLLESGVTFDDVCRIRPEVGREILERARREQDPNIPFDLHLMPHQGLMLYDVTAQRCGFKRNAEGDYEYNLRAQRAAA